MGRKSNATKIRELLEVDHELINHTNNDTDFGMCWMHKITGEYFTNDDIVEKSKFLLKFNIDKHITHGTGFSTKDQKWYGWSHRAIYGFEIESTVKLGDCGYIADSLEDAIANVNNFWKDEWHQNTTSEVKFKEDENMDMIYTSWTYNNKVPNKKLRNTISGTWTEIPKLGKGEWTAKTLDDAKQMAEDFSKGVS